jgi:chromosome segregation ATPase
MSILRIRPRGSLTYHRAVLTPRATNAATYQYNGQLKPMGTTTGETTELAFIEDLEAKLGLTLQQNLSAVETFRVYQSAFTTVIEKFAKQAGAMRKVKDGYDSIIDSLFAENRRAMSLHKQIQHSVSNLDFQLFDTQEKIDSKRREFTTKIDMCSRIVADLRVDIAALEQDVRVGRVEHQVAENRGAQTAMLVAHLEKKLSKAEAKHANWVQTCQDLQMELAVKLEFENQARDSLEQILNQLCDRSRTVRELKVSIADLRPRVKAARKRLAERRRLLQEELPKKPQLQENLKEQHKQIKMIVKQNEEVGSMLRVELSNIQVEDRAISMHYEDLTRLMALYISRMNGYRDGIDPTRFPDLA